MVVVIIQNGLLFSSLSFKIRIGGGSVCGTAENGENIVVEYLVQHNGSFIQFLNLDSYGNIIPY